MSNESTAVARSEPEDEFAGSLVSQYQRDRMIRSMARQIANESWGKNLSPHTQAAMARYAMEAGLDPVRHIDVLGGRVYINAAAYMDRLAADPEFEGVVFDPISDNAEERARWGVPDFARAVFLVTIRHRGREFQEIGYAPKRANDSVGKEFPAEKARTSGIRRAARMAVPMWTQKMEQQFESVEALLSTERAAIPVQPKPRELVSVVRRAGGASNDWESAEVEPDRVKPVKRTVIPGSGMTQVEVEAYNAELRAEGEVEEFPANVMEDPE
jgi:hypothetical protein